MVGRSRLLVRIALVFAAGNATLTARAETDDLSSAAVDRSARPGPTDRVIVPPSSREAPGDVGRRAHTNYEIEVPGRRIDGPAPP